MFSTTAIKKDSQFSGRVVGTHQRLDQAARRSLGVLLPRGKYFPSSKDIIHFEGVRGPDGLKRKSPGIDEPSHMLTQEEFDKSIELATAARGDFDESLSLTEEAEREGFSESLSPAEEAGHENLDERSVMTMILDHRWNLVKALKDRNHVRAAFEAAWMAHMITDGLTPAHHFPLSDVKDELMTDKEMMKVFGQPIKGLMHGRSLPETMRNNWLYWGAGGHMSKHIAYEYGVLMITAPLTPKSLQVELSAEELQKLDTEAMFQEAYRQVRSFKMYDRFRNEGWATDLATETKNLLLPEIVKAITLGWYSAVVEAYHLPLDKKAADSNSASLSGRRSGIEMAKKKVADSDITERTERSKKERY